MFFVSLIPMALGVALMVEGCWSGDTLLIERNRVSTVRGAVLVAIGMSIALLSVKHGLVASGNGVILLQLLVAAGAAIAAGVVERFSEERRYSMLANAERELPLPTRTRYRALTRLERLRWEGELPGDRNDR
jgi:hypothetical protein